LGELAWVNLPNIAICLRWLCISRRGLIVKGFQLKGVSTTKTRDQSRQRVFVHTYHRS
jgi:hypothetical protein